MFKLGKKVVALALSATLFLTGCAGTSASSEQKSEKVYKIGITQIVEHPALNLDRQGFIDEMEAQGFVAGKNAEFIVKSAQGDPNLAKTIADQFVHEGVDLIAAISTPSAQAAAMATRNTGIPVVYIAVTDPVSAGLIPAFDRPSGTNITGVYNGSPIEQQMDLILEIQPDVKKLGYLYNAGEDNSVSIKKRMEEYLKTKNIEVVAVTVASSNEVSAAAQSLVGRVDAIFYSHDNTVMSALETVVRIAQDNDIPFYAGDIESVKRGALATVGNDEYDCGVQSAIIAARILRGEKAGDIPSELVRKYALIVNQSVAKEYNVEIPQTVLERADEIL